MTIKVTDNKTITIKIDGVSHKLSLDQAQDLKRKLDKLLVPVPTYQQSWHTSDGICPELDGDQITWTS